MTEAAEKLKPQLATLPEEDREALACFLVRTLPDECDDDEWTAELIRRERELETGEVREIPAEEVFSKLKRSR